MRDGLKSSRQSFRRSFRQRLGACWGPLSPRKGEGVARLLNQKSKIKNQKFLSVASTPQLIPPPGHSRQPTQPGSDRQPTSQEHGMPRLFRPAWPTRDAFTGFRISVAVRKDRRLAHASKLKSRKQKAESRNQKIAMPGCPVATEVSEWRTRKQPRPGSQAGAQVIHTQYTMSIRNRCLDFRFSIFDFRLENTERERRAIPRRSPI
jgi:hypothetical protein